ncbi:aminoacyl-tRNA hydrolase [Candidatus Parcubacteria bacterium]|nr:aminoacyl-tRNA hydrolase [Candidatus Parcubacteria bacterium]
MKYKKIIIGLGNPGDKYKKTRHNVGFLALDKIANKLNLRFNFDKKINAEIIKTDGTILIKPMTFMNNSGQAVEAVMSYFKILPKKLGFIKIKNCDLSNILTVIHDDLDINQGKIKTSIDSRSGGHNGVQSIINHLKTKKFKRIRIGIKNELKEKIPAEKFVLMRFSNEEMDEIDEILNEIILNM